MDGVNNENVNYNFRHHREKTYRAKSTSSSPSPRSPRSVPYATHSWRFDRNVNHTYRTEAESKFVC